MYIRKYANVRMTTVAATYPDRIPTPPKPYNYKTVLNNNS